MPILIWLILAWDALTGREPIVRGADEQARVDRECEALSLYHFQACPYCRKVRRDIRLLSLRIDARDIRREPSRRAELVAGGGTKQVPCLRIVEGDGAVRWFYESRDIGRYLRSRFAPPRVS
jgi:glutathione S-transferase